MTTRWTSLVSLVLCCAAWAQPPPPVNCKLQVFPPLAEAPAGLVASQDFDAAVTTAAGNHRYAPGRTGQALYLDMPDGGYELPLAEPRAMPTGTIEWWVKPRPAAQVWLDQGWHYFLHCAPARPEGVRIDLLRSPATQLQLSASLGDPRAATPLQTIQIKTNSTDLQQWHHLLVSWDFSGERQSLWLLLDGAGQQVTFPKIFEPPTFSSLQFGNTPLGDDTPFLPMDGGIDEVRVSNEAVSGRLAE